MKTIATEYLLGLLKQTDNQELADALKEAGDDEKKVQAVIKKALTSHIDTVRTESKEEGRKMGERVTLDARQKAFAEKHEVSNKGKFEDVVERAIEKHKKSDSKTLDKKTIRESQVYIDDLAELKKAKETLEAEIETKDKKTREKDLETGLRAIAVKSLQGKYLGDPKDKGYEAAKERKITRYVKSLKLENAWDLDKNGKPYPIDEDGNPLKDAMQVRVDGDKVAKDLADEFFPDAKADKKKPPTFGKNAKTGESSDFEIPEFEGTEEEKKAAKQNFYDGLDKDGRKAYAAAVKSKLKEEAGIKE